MYIVYYAVENCCVGIWEKFRRKNYFSLFSFPPKPLNIGENRIINKEKNKNVKTICST